jgi:mono/diheme cytochrome c family protein
LKFAQTIRRIPPRRFHRIGSVVIGLAGLFALSALMAVNASPAPAPAPAPAAHPDPAAVAIDRQFHDHIRPIFSASCYDCHGNGEHKGGLSLDKFTSLAEIQADRGTWQAIQSVVELKMMPPKDEDPLTHEQIHALAGFVDDALDYCDLTAPRDPGRVMLHRLNRNEYIATIRDLLGVDVGDIVRSNFPADDTGYGFDNIADVLSMSPLLAEQYLSTAQTALDRAIVEGNPFARKTIHLDAHAMTATEGYNKPDAWLLDTNGELSKRVRFVTTGDYEFRIRAEGDQAGDEPVKMTLQVDDKLLKTFDVPAVRGTPDTYTLRVNVTGGNRRVAVAFINDFYDPTNPAPTQRDRNLYVRWVDIDGPINSGPFKPGAMQNHIFFTAPSATVTAESAASQILQQFASRAYRRPATDGQVQRLLAVYRKARGDGQSFVSSVKVAMSAVLVSPRFLFRIEPDPGNNTDAVRPLDDYELASRLSYFLWSSMPDDELIRLAAAGTLRDPAVLDAQVRRMLVNPKSHALVDNFVGQWLELRNLDASTPDPKFFPKYDYHLKNDMRTEAQLYFSAILHDNRSLLDLIDSHYTYVNERLAALYGIPGVAGDSFREVELTGTPAEHERGGVMTMAGVLTVTSMPARTSPVKRGKWILSDILGDPPPPPPPNVPTIPARPVPHSKITFHQRLEIHRANISCASCHARMDPLGFSMEHYDAIGVWRDRDGSAPVDATGALPDGQNLDGIYSLKALVMARKDKFVQCLAEKMLTYALGRGLEDYDRPTVHDICLAVEQDHYSAQSLILAIVHSDAFEKHRTGPSGSN